MPVLTYEYGKRPNPALCIYLKMVGAFILLPSHDINADKKKYLLFLPLPFLHCVLTTTAKVICYLLEVVVLSLKLFSPQLLLQPVPVQIEIKCSMR